MVFTVKANCSFWGVNVAEPFSIAVNISHICSAPSAESLAASSPAVSSVPIAVSYSAMMSPVSSQAAVFIKVTPVLLSPFITAY